VLLPPHARVGAAGLIWVPRMAYLRFSKVGNPRLQICRLRWPIAAELKRAAWTPEDFRAGPIASPVQPIGSHCPASLRNPLGASCFSPLGRLEAIRPAMPTKFQLLGLPLLPLCNTRNCTQHIVIACESRSAASAPYLYRRMELRRLQGCNLHVPYLHPSDSTVPMLTLGLPAAVPAGDSRLLSYAGDAPQAPQEPPQAPSGRWPAAIARHLLRFPQSESDVLRRVRDPLCQLRNKLRVICRPFLN
jgi:hypothetical protein